MATPDQTNIASYVADYGVGIDCHSRFIQVFVLARLGDTISHWDRRYSTTWEDLCEARDWVISTLSQTIAERAPSATTLTYCIESTAAYHYPVMLCWGGYSCVVNPLLAHAGRRKTDRLDARALAHQAITGTWKPSYTAPVDIECCRLALNHRRRLVSERTRLTNSLNNLVLRFGHTFAAHFETMHGASGGLYGRTALPIFEALSQGKLPRVKGISPHVIPPDVQLSMREVMERVNELNRAVTRQSNRLATIVEKTEFVCRGGELIRGAEIMAHQRTIPGVGPLLSAVWLAQVGDATRFKNARLAQLNRWIAKNRTSTRKESSSAGPSSGGPVSSLAPKKPK